MIAARTTRTAAVPICGSENFFPVVTPVPDPGVAMTGAIPLRPTLLRL